MSRNPASLASAALLSILSTAASAQLGAPAYDGAMLWADLMPQKPTLADFDGDGVLDLATPMYANGVNEVHIRLGNGDGGFGPALELNVGQRPIALAAEDFDADGDVDLAIANATATTGCRIYLGDGLGGFTFGSAVAITNQSSDIAAGDLDNDSDLDLVVTNTGGDIWRCINDGAGNFSPLAAISTGADARHLVLADFTHDGNLDLAITISGPFVYFSSGDGTGGFQPPQLFSVGPSVSTLAAGTLNSDAHLDIVTCNDATLSVLLGDGTGGFAPALILSATQSPRGVAIADLDGDGNNDLVVTGGGGGSQIGYASTRLGNGGGNFPVTQSRHVGKQAGECSLGDVDGDGRLDVVTSVNIVDSVNAGTLRGVLVLRTDGLGQFVLNESVPYAAGGPVHNLITELNGDGRPDLVISNAIANTVDLALGRGLGRFEVVTSLPALPNPYYTSAGDLNHDGLLDLVTAIFSMTGSGNVLLVYLGTGALTFAPPVQVPVPAETISVELADMNSDGNLDALVPDYFGDNVALLFGDGFGGFGAPVNFPAGNGPTDIVVADIDHDGELDVVVADFDGSGVSVLHGDGTGQLGAPMLVTAVLVSGPRDVTLGDFDADGWDDILFTAQGFDRLWLALSNGTGGFHTPVWYPEGDTPRFAASGDFDGDGNLDAACSNETSGTVTIWYGDGTGELVDVNFFASNGHPYGLAMGDLDADGTPDLVSTDYGSAPNLPGVTVMRNRRKCAPRSYCTAGTTTNGCTPWSDASGTPSVSATSGFTVTVYRTEGQKLGLFFYGISGRKDSVWSPGSSSFLCVKSPVQRTPTQNSGGTSGACDGVFTLDLASYWATHPTALGQPLLAGDVIDVQAWFRDPAAPGTTNLSGGIEVVMCP